MADSKNNVKGINVSALKRPIPTYQHYVEHFEELYRQSPLAKVIHKDAFPGMVSMSAPQTRAASRTGPFKVPFASPHREKHSTSSDGVPAMSPVAQLFHQMKKKGTTLGPVLHSHSKETNGCSESSSIPSGKEDKQKKITHDDEPRNAVHTVLVKGTRDEDGSQEQTAFEAADLDGGHKENGGEMELEDQEARHDPMQSEFVVDTQKEAKKGGPHRRFTRSCKDVPAKMVSRGQRTSSADHLNSVPETPKESTGQAGDSWTETPKTSKKTETVLDQWIIKWLGSSHKHVSVEGHREEDPEGAFWHSTAISVRISSHVLETASGSRYRLKGNINKLLTIDQGFSPHLVQRFQKGFPSNWKALLQQEAKELSTESDVSAGTAVKARGKKKGRTATVQKSKAATKSATPATRKVAKEEGNHTQLTTPQALLEKTEREPGTRDKKTAKSSTKKNQAGQKNSVTPATPTCINISEVGKTRSGRKVIPPLQFWSGQRQRSIPALNDATEILEGSIDYTPVSVTSVRLQGSIKISKREERLFKRLGKSHSTRQGKSRDGSSLDPSSQSDVTESDRELTSAVESEDSGKRISNRKGASKRTRKVEKETDRNEAKENDVMEEQVLASSPAKQHSMPPSRAKGQESQESDPGDTEERTSSSHTDTIEKNHQSDGSVTMRRTSLRLCNNHAPKKSPGEVGKNSGDLSVTEKSQRDQRVSTDKSGRHNRYDLYSAVMGVVEKHRRHRLSRSSRRSQGEMGQGDISKSRSSEDCSYSVSDDEDFSGDISSADQDKKSQPPSPKGVRGTKDTSITQSLRLTGIDTQTAHGITNKTDVHGHRRTKNSKYSGPPLLGSNMLPAVLLNRCDTVQTMNSPMRDKNDATEGSSDQSKTSHSKTDHQELSRDKESSDVGASSERNTDDQREISKQLKGQKSVQRGKAKADEWTESQQQKDVESTESQQVSDETPRARVSRKKRTFAHQDAVERGEKWSPSEVHRLQRALKVIPPSCNQFWLRVAASVGTRTDWECQQLHQAKLAATSKASSKTRSSKKEHQKAAKEPVTLTAAKGTMRRKRQLKEFIEQHNQNYDDNLFDSTPFKKQKVTKKTLQNLDLDDDDDEEEEEGVAGKTPGTGRMKTPSTRLFSILAPLSSKKTPHSTLISPGLLHSVERKHTEQYIHGIQKKRPIRGKARKSPETVRKIAHKKGGVGLAAVDPSMVDAFQIEPIMEHDPEEEGEADYYWSDDEQ